MNDRFWPFAVAHQELARLSGNGQEQTLIASKEGLSFC
jgi:hypothetical protein